MKYRKSLSSLLLATVLLGTLVPVTSFAETQSSTSTVASSSVSTEPSSSETVEPSSSSQVEPSSSEIVEPSSSTTTEPSSSEVTEPSSSSPTTPSASTNQELGVQKDLFGHHNYLEAIIGRDDQFRVNNTKAFPYRTVVHLEMEYADGAYIGSGVLIAPNLVLTVAHNLYNQKTKTWARNVIATPGQSGAYQPYGQYVASNYYILRTYKTEGQQIPSNYDIAVIRLNRNVPASVGYLPVSQSLRSGERVQIPGYPAATDAKVGDMYTSFGNITSLNSVLIEHHVDTEGGNSGSPILNARNEVVGVHSAGYYTYGIYGTKNWGRRVDAAVLRMIDIAKNSKETTVEVASYKETRNGATYRLYNPSIKRHLYTQDLDEANFLQSRGWKFEGLSFRTLTQGRPVYRLYHRGLREHIYSTDAQERDALVRGGSWSYEGVAFYSGGNTAIYRLYHTGLRIHLYSSDPNEVRALSSRGWKNEGIVFYTK